MQRLYICTDRWRLGYFRQRAWGVPCLFFMVKTMKPLSHQKQQTMLQNYLGSSVPMFELNEQAVDLLPAGFTHPLVPNKYLLPKKKIIHDGLV